MKYGMLLVLALTVLVGCEPTQPTASQRSHRKHDQEIRWLPEDVLGGICRSEIVSKHGSEPPRYSSPARARGLGDP